MLARILELAVNPKPVLQKACLAALRRAATMNDVLCLELINMGLDKALLAVLETSPAVDNKLECIGFFGCLVQKGHISVNRGGTNREATVQHCTAQCGY